MSSASDLQKRAIHCPRWKWIEGMAYRDTYMGLTFYVSSPHDAWQLNQAMVGEFYPILESPATQGVLIAYLQDLYKTLEYPQFTGDHWVAFGFQAATLVEALITALGEE